MLNNNNCDNCVCVSFSEVYSIFKCISKIIKRKIIYRETIFLLFLYSFHLFCCMCMRRDIFVVCYTMWCPCCVVGLLYRSHMDSILRGFSFAYGYSPRQSAKFAKINLQIFLSLGNRACAKRFLNPAFLFFSNIFNHVGCMCSVVLYHDPLF